MTGPNHARTMTSEAMAAMLTAATDADLRRLRAMLEAAMRKRGVAFAVGDVGEELVVAYFNGTSGLPNLQHAPPGTKNVDALSRTGERYSIKSVWTGQKTGTIYPDSGNQDKQLFENLLVARLSAHLELQSIHQFSWEAFVQARSWDKRMNAWYLSMSKRSLSVAEVVMSASEGS